MRNSLSIKVHRPQIGTTERTADVLGTVRDYATGNLRTVGCTLNAARFPSAGGDKLHVSLYNVDKDVVIIPSREQRALRDILERLTEKVARANNIQHSGGTVLAEDWSELYALQNEAKAALKAVAS